MSDSDFERTARRGKVLVSLNTSWNAVNFRGGLLTRLVQEGYEVVVAAPRDRFSAGIKALGCRFVDLSMQPHGRSPVADLALLGRYLRLLRAERPDFYLGYTAKPNIYGSIAAELLGIPVVNNIAGLGSVFNESGVTNRIVKALYRLALRRSAHVFFQNSDDQSLFVRDRLADANRTSVLPGSGVDLIHFAPPPSDKQDERPFVFLLVSRLLKEKGVAELVAAGREVRARHPGTEIRLLGHVQSDSPAYVSRAELAAWEAEGAASFLGAVPDVRPHLAVADCVVLPTFYPEGTPRALLEAAAMGKPIITCDMPGCRDVVAQGENGFLVPPRDVDSLASRMIDMIELAPAALRDMGRKSRELAERRFDERIVVERYLNVLEIVRNGGSRSSAVAG